MAGSCWEARREARYKRTNKITNERGPAASVTNPPTMWLARTGESGYALTDCVKAGVVALRYHTVPDAQTLSVAEIAEYVKQAKTRVNNTRVAQMLHDFIHEVRTGDIVVTTHLGDRAVYFGEITGPYQWADPPPVTGFFHFREVEWWGSLSRDTQVPADKLSEIDRRETFYRLPNQSYWLERANIARSTTAKVAPPRRMAQPGSSGAGGSKFQASAPTKLCPNCGLTQPAAIVTADGCGDCT